MAKGVWRLWNTPRCKEIGWQSFKQEDSTFYFVRNHFESIGKPILLKGGKVLLVNKMLIRAQVIVTKNTHKLFHKSLSKPIMTIGATNFSHSVPPIPTSHSPMPNPSHSVQPILHRCHRFQLPTFCLAIFKPRYHRVLPVGLTEFLDQLPR